jgi:hypothetical protein
MSRVNIEIRDGALGADVTTLLRSLRQIDPDLRREVPDRIKNTPGAQGLLADVRSRQPNQPTTGWHVGPSRKTSPGRLNWSPGRIRQQITLQFRSSRPRGAPADSWPVLRIASKNAAQNVFELADNGEFTDTTQGYYLGRYLRLYYGKGGSRTIWPAIEQWAGRIEDEIEDIFQDYANRVNRAAKRAA